jgi:hypothetical protein
MLPRVVASLYHSAVRACPVLRFYLGSRNEETLPEYAFHESPFDLMDLNGCAWAEIRSWEPDKTLVGDSMAQVVSIHTLVRPTDARRCPARPFGFDGVGLYSHWAWTEHHDPQRGH